MLSRLLIVPRAALDATAWTLRTAADLTEHAARMVREGPADGSTEPGERATVTGAAPTPAPPQEPSAPAPAPEAGRTPADEAPAEVAPPPVVPAGRRRKAAVFSPELLAAAPVRRVVAGLDELSSTELSALYEHEAATRNRKTLLRAIEQSLVPPDPVRGTRSPAEAAEDEALTNVRDMDVAPDSETVYTTP